MLEEKRFLKTVGLDQGLNTLGIFTHYGRRFWCCNISLKSTVLGLVGWCNRESDAWSFVSHSPNLLGQFNCDVRKLKGYSTYFTTLLRAPKMGNRIFANKRVGNTELE